MVPYFSLILRRSDRPTPVVPRLTTIAVSISPCGSGLIYSAALTASFIATGIVPGSFCPRHRKKNITATCMTFMQISFFM